MTKFVVTKNGKSVGKLFGSPEEAEELAELERVADLSADVRVESYPVVTVGENLDPGEGQALVDAILDVADLSDLPSEHQGPTGFLAGGHDEVAPDPAPGQDDLGNDEWSIQALKMDGVSFVPVDEVLEWAKGQSVCADKLFAL